MVSGGKWLVGGLLASLAINVFLVGALAGRYFATGSNRFPAAVAPARPGSAAVPQLAGPIARLAQSLPEPSRGPFLRALDQHRGQLLMTGAEVRDARIRLGETTVANPFDRASFIAASAQLDARLQAQRKAYAEALADGLAVLPADARRAFVEPQRQQGAPARRRQE